MKTTPRKLISSAMLALAVVSVVSLLLRPARTEEDAAAKAKGGKFFDEQVKPLLKKHCLKCHGATASVKGGLRLTTRESVLEGGDSGPAVSLKDPDESMLLSAIEYESYEMPPTGKLPAKERQVLARWVKLGLPWGSEKSLADVEPTEEHGSPQVNEKTRNFWSYRPMQHPDAPAVKNRDWVNTPIDAFVLAKLEEAGLEPASPASKQVLIRRAYYNLTGLPPSPENVREFLADESPNAYEKLIDRLLESPQYGEHWARHWLDLVRYAETNSYERDGRKPNAWRYRDYVIRAFNDDKPYDQFIREQLAGDEMEPRTDESLIATGYYRLGIWDDEPADPELALYDDLDDIQKTTAQVFLGMTLNCARCHEHKLDPIPHADYYRMLAFYSGVKRFGVRSFETIKRNSLRPLGTPEEIEQQSEAIAEHKKQVEQNKKRIAKIERVVRKDFQEVEKQEFRHEMNKIPLVKKRVPDVISQETFEKYVALKDRQKELNRSRPPALDMALCVTEVGPEPRQMHRLIRGNPQGKAEPVEPGFPTIFGDPDPVIPEPEPGDTTSGRRTALAEWIANPENPRTARVFVNRVWQYQFGRGIVRTPNEFGMQGERPTHPKLLDWLAQKFIEGGWKVKPLQKMIMMSNTYRMSSQSRPEAVEKDPQNDLFWRFDMRRLTAEEVRDSVLAVNGALNRDKMYGPSIYTIIPQEVLAGQSRPGAGWGNSPLEERNRRSIYIHVKRSLITPILKAFDAADADSTCPVRFTTAQPTQSLAMLNGEFINREAKVFAENLQKTAENDTKRQVAHALWRTLQREPTEKEIARGVKLIETMKTKYGADDETALINFCVVALNLNEFLYLD